MDIKSFTHDDATVTVDLVEDNLEVQLHGKAQEVGFRLTPDQADELYSKLDSALEVLDQQDPFDDLPEYLYEDGTDPDEEALQKEVDGTLLRHSDRGGVIEAPESEPVDFIRNTPTPVGAGAGLSDDTEALDRHLPESTQETGKPAVDKRPKATQQNKPLTKAQKQQNAEVNTNPTYDEDSPQAKEAVKSAKGDEHADTHPTTRKGR